MITYRKLKNTDNYLINEFISDEGDSYQEFLNMGWSLNQIIKQLFKNSNFSLGAYYNGSLISFILGDLFNIEKISEYEILLLYVSKKFRRKGLGLNLINKIEANNRSLKKIYLEVSKNNVEAISFYKKMNFKKVFTRRNYFISGNTKFDALVMSKNY